jgi:hypothetical protein
VSFLSWGDFNVPFTWAAYWAKHFYIWSFQSGTPNPDGLIRLPGRVLNFLTFGLAGNVGAGYFYIFASLAVAFIAFFLFARKFLEIKRTSVQVLGALFFAVNPIFLGNLAKVGLVLAAAMLPLCLLAIRAAFVHKKFRFLLVYAALLNLSFLHPYTFTVNLAVSGAYAVWMAWQHRAWVRDKLLQFALVGVFAVAINLYFVLPMYAMGTVSKDVISTNITPVAVDYTALVGISNTGDLFTGFSLSKNVFVDFAFYNPAYQTVYFFGVFLFYVLLFGLYLYTERKLSLNDKRRLGVLFASFLVLLALAATTIAHLDTLIKFLISMPGGWAFRSPLKWQLYIPLALFGILVVLLNRVEAKGKRLAVLSGLLLTFIIMNGYLFLDIGAKLLTPRRPIVFAKLASMNMDNKTVLLINNGECMDFMRANPAVTTELNQVFTSKNTQLKHVLEDNTDAVNLGSYDYVLGCFDRQAAALTWAYNFRLADTFANGAFRLYTNQAAPRAVGATANVYRVPDPQAMAHKYRFVTSTLSTDFNFVTDDTHPTTGLADAFEALQPKDIGAGEMRAALPGGAEASTLHIRGSKPPLFYGADEGTLTLAPTPLPQLLPAGKAVELPGNTRTITYKDPALKTQNLVSNGSLEKGLWQLGVTDCYAYDDKPAIGMQLSQAHKTAGKQALELMAQRHIACTGPDPIPVTSGQHYLLSFDYQSPSGGKYAGYYVSFDDPQKTVVMGRMQNKDDAWHTFSKEVAAPGGARSARLLLYAYPDSYNERQHIARYDQISLQPIPPAQDRFYLTTQPGIKTKAPKQIRYTIDNPTRKTARILGASQPFYLTTNETYHEQWRASVTGGGIVAAADHLKLNGTMNGWYIDPAKLCQHGGCTKTTNGYDFTIIIEFVPQRWFYLGGAISAVALAGGTAYFIYERRRGRPLEGRWLWRQ